VYLANAGTPNLMTLDESTGYMYWTNIGADGTVRAAPLDGGPQLTVADHQGSTWAIHVGAGYVFWSVGLTGYVNGGATAGLSVRALPLNAGFPEAVHDGGPALLTIDNNVACAGIATYSGNVIWAAQATGTNLRTRAIAGGTTTNSHALIGSNPTSMIVRRGNLFVGDGSGELERHPADLLSDGGVLTSVNGSGETWAMHVAGEVVFWGSASNALQRYDTSDAGYVEVTNQAVPTLAAQATAGAFAMTALGDYVYYTTRHKTMATSYGIYRVPLLGPRTAPEIVVAASGSGATATSQRGIVASGNFIYWAESNRIMALRPAGQ
jgi:hypothetical protein